MQCLELVTGGMGWVENRGEWIPTPPGTLLWHIPGDHTIGRSDFDHPYRCLAVRLNGPTPRSRTIPRITRWNELDEARRFTEEVVRLYTGGKMSPETLCSYIVTRLRFQAELHLMEEPHEALPLSLRKVLLHLEQHYSNNIKLADLARISGWSIPHLHDRFQEYFKTTPHQWLTDRRLAAAREKLAGGNDPVKSIASDCGFSSAAAFCAQFRKKTGLTPKNYRQQQMALGR